MKCLPLELAKHPLLIKAFKGEDGRFTTEKVWHEYLKSYDIEDQNLLPEKGSTVAPAADLEELLDLAWSLNVYGKGDAICTEAEKKLKKELKNIAIRGNRLTRLAEAIIPVLEERK